MNDPNPTRQLHDLGQSLWIDNIDRDMLATGKLQGYVTRVTAGLP